MRSYGQYCPIARASELLAQRWTPIILRNLLNGATAFNEIAADAPGIPRSLLTARLRELGRAGIVEITPGPKGRGHAYRPTAAGRDLAGVLTAMGSWADRWLELRPEHVDPGLLLHSWCRHTLARDKLPDRRVVVRFDFADRPRTVARLWFVVDGDRSEVCSSYPGFPEDLLVECDARVLTEWHLGALEWGTALRAGTVRVSGPPDLARALPTWNRRGVPPDAQPSSGDAAARGSSVRGPQWSGEPTAQH